MLYFSLKKSQQLIPLHIPHWDLYGERYLHTGHIYISLDISVYLKGPKKRASLHVSQKRGPYGNGKPIPESYLTSFRVPSKRALPPGPSHGVPLEKCALSLEPTFIHHSKSPIYKPSPHDLKFSLNIKGPLWREMPISGAFLNISSSVPSKGALPRGPLN
jgi:hypothetical protein